MDLSDDEQVLAGNEDDSPGEVEMTEQQQEQEEATSDQGADNVKQEDSERSYLLKDILKDWSASYLIGFFVVTYWRGTWTLLDNWDCNQPTDASVIDGETFCFASDVRSTARRDSGILTYWISFILLTVGVLIFWLGLWTPSKDSEGMPYVSRKRIVIRFFAIYILGAAAVCMWRGIWYMTDYWILSDNLRASWWTTTGAGLGGAFLLLGGASALAPPAMFILDGPSIHSPPVAVTLLSSFFDITLPADTLPPKLPQFVYSLDIVVSFFGMPILVVWYWRGFWGVMDNYLWGFSLDGKDFGLSLLYSFIIAFGCFGIASDDVVNLVTVPNKFLYRVLTRVRTIFLAVGAVNFWRVFWYMWDQYWATTSYASAIVSHVVAVAALTAMGCLSCICAPPATMGVDVLAHPDCSDEPLFSNVPVPGEALFFLAIARQPLEVAKVKEEVAEEDEELKSARQLKMEQLQALGGATRHLVTYYEWQRRLPRPKRKECEVDDVLSHRAVAKREHILFRNR